MLSIFDADRLRRSLQATCPGVCFVIWRDGKSGSYDVRRAEDPILSPGWREIAV